VAVKTEGTEVAQLIGALVAEGHYVVNVKYWPECHGAEVTPVALPGGYYQPYTWSELDAIVAKHIFLLINGKSSSTAAGNQ